MRGIGVVVIGALAVSLAVGGCGGDRDASPRATVKTESLFVQTAHSGSFTKGELRLDEVAPITISFADRPARQRGSLSTADFSDRFAQLFGDDPPNATVSSLQQGRGEFVVELSRPRYDANRHELVYAVKAVGGQDADLPARVGPVSLFIDAAGVGTSVIQGTVSSQDDEALPGATIELDRIAPGVDPEITVTAANGSYSFRGLQSPGMYELEANLEGFQTVTKSVDLESDGGGGAEVDFTLAPTTDTLTTD